jgi:hypothetical protein
MTTPAEPEPFTLERAQAEIDRQTAEHDTLAKEHKRPIAVELGRKQLGDLEAEIHAQQGADTGPLVSLHGLQVVSIDTDDHFALVYSGVAGA